MSTQPNTGPAEPRPSPSPAVPESPEPAQPDEPAPDDVPTQSPFVPGK